MYTAALPILHDEKEVGVTFHKIDAGIDTGDIIAQKKFLLDEMTSRELYFQYIAYGTKLVTEHIEEVLAHKECATPQPASDSTYYSKKSIDYGHLSLELNQTARNIHNQLRAYNFREYQLPCLENGTALIGDRITNIRSREKPGTILMETQGAILMATIDYNILLYKDRFVELLDACKQGDDDKVCEICTVDAHINVQDDSGWSPLMVATIHNQKKIVKYLISKGADIQQINYCEETMLDLARKAYKKFGDDELVQLYERLGLVGCNNIV
jgi:methionyl-tRNA formyltransferase